MKDRLFIGVYPCGIVYADKSQEEHGDYKRLAFLPYKELELDIKPDCPADLKKRIEQDAAKIIEMRGQTFPISTSANQTVILGE